MAALLSAVKQAYEKRWPWVLDIYRVDVRSLTKTCSILSLIYKENEQMHHCTVAYERLINCISLLITKTLNKILRPVIEQKHISCPAFSLSICYKID